ncbi:MAG: D-alanine--D-alanine ligase [Rikenellaceae bacterium]
MKRPLIAIVAGGDSSEHQISINGAKNILLSIDKTKYTPYIVILSSKTWHVEFNNEIFSIDKNDFSFTVGGTKHKFDFAFINIHGTPGENGILQSYFELIALPYSSCGVDASVVTFNKMVCKRVVSSVNIHLAKDLIITKNDKININSIAKHIGFPMFIKPNSSGSSFGVTKVKEIEGIEPAIAEAFKESDIIIIEEFIEGHEYGQGIYTLNGELVVLPLTEIVSNRDFFDYLAKYEGHSEEITPAVIDPKVRQDIADDAKKIYKITGCKGVVRIDFIVKNNIPYMIEVNSVPGMSAASIVPQQVKASGKTLTEFYTEIIKASTIKN